MEPLDASAPSCVQHPGISASFTCARCGAFACEDCRSGSQSTLCPPCAAREVAPSVDFLDALSAASEIGAQTLAGLAPILLIQAVLVAAIKYAEEIAERAWIAAPSATFGKHFLGGLFLVSLLSLGAGVVNGLVNAIVDAIKIQRFADVAQRQERSLEAVVGLALRRFPPMALLMTLLNGGLGMVMVLCCIAGVVGFAFVSFAEQEVMLSGQGPLGALERSYHLVRRAYWRIALITLVVIVASMVFAFSARMTAPLLPVSALSQAIWRAALVAFGQTLIGFASDAYLTTLYLRFKAAGWDR
jgi:uncharacterized membrane protein (DUF485 family)